MVREKGYRAKLRNTGKRRMKRILLVSAEGNKNNKTEKIYLSHFKNEDTEIRFAAGNETDPETMMRRLIEETEEYELTSKDLAVCLIDSDFDPKRDKAIADAERQIPQNQRENIRLIVSSPSFEIWYICHFGYSTRQYQNKEEVLGELSKYIPGYKKSRDIYPNLVGKGETACQNARKLETWCRENHKRPHHVEHMPSTEMYKVWQWLKGKE